MSLKHPILIFSLITIHRLLQTILPCFTLINGNNTNFSQIEQFSKLFYFNNFSIVDIYDQSQLFSKILLQITIMSILTSVLYILLSQSLNKMRQMALLVLTFLYYLSTILLIIQSQIFSQSLIKLVVPGTSSSTNQVIICLQFIIILLLSCLNLTLTLLVCALYKSINHSYDLQAENLLCGRFCLKQMTIDLITKIGIILLVSSANTELFGKVKFIYFIIIFISACLRLAAQLTYYQYNSTSTSQFNQHILSIQVSFLLATMISLLSPLYFQPKNYFIIIFALNIFAIVALRTYIFKNQHKIKLLSTGQIKNNQQAVLYYLNVSKMINQARNESNYKEKQSFYLKNLVTLHQKQCSKIECLCKTEQPKVKVEKLYKLIFQQIKKMLLFNQRAHKNLQLQILVLYQRLKYNKNFISHNNISNTQKLTWFSKIIKQKYALTVQNFIQKRQYQHNIVQTQIYSQFQKLQLGLQDIIRITTNLKIKFWNTLKKKSISQQQFYDICLNQLKMMRKCCQFKQIVLKDYRHNFLVNLLFMYEKFILLYSKPSSQLSQLSEKQKQIANNPIFKIQKTQRITVQKYVESPLACFIEASLATKSLGNIINAYNTQQIFGYSISQLLNTNISKLMPKIFQKQHETILQNWTNGCSWKNLGHCRQIFLNDKKGRTICCKIYLKVVQRWDFGENNWGGVNILGTLFKEQAKDYIIIDQKEYIVGAGQVFINLFNKTPIGLPLKITCEGANSRNLSNVKNKYAKRSSIFYSLQNYKDSLKSLIKMEKQSIDLTPQTVKKITQYQKGQLYKYNVQYQISDYKIGNLFVLLLKIISVKKQSNKIPSSNSNQLCKTLYFIDNFCQNQHQNSSNQNMKPKQLFFSNKVIVQPSIVSSKSSLSTSFENNIVMLQNIFYKRFNYSAKKIQNGYKKTKIYDIKILRIVYSIVVLVLAGISLSFIKLYMNFNGFDEMQALFFRDGACSDNMQLSMIIYNRALNIYSSAKQIQNLHNLGNSLNSTQYSFSLAYLQNEIKHKNQQFNYLHSLLVNETYLVSQSLTKLTRKQIYAYQNLNTTWLKSNGQPITILVINFIVNYLYHVDKISQISANIIKVINETKQEKNKLLKLLNEHFITLQTNFPFLYALNSDLLSFYRNLFESTANTIKLIGYFKLVFTIIINFSIIMILFCHLKYRSRQLTRINSVLTKIQPQNIQLICVYFLKLNIYLNIEMGLVDEAIKTKTSYNFSSSVLKQQTQKSTTLFMNQLHQQTLVELKLKKPDYCISNLKFTVFNNLRSILLKILLFSILISITMINILMIKAQNNILNTTKNMMNDFNGLMDSQNHLIGSYIQAKGQSLIYQQGNIESQNNNLRKIIEKLMININMTQVQFNRVAISSLGLFEMYDKNYAENMINILVGNICYLMKESVSDDYYRQCIQDQHNNIIKNGGVINGMNYFSRILQQTFSKYLNYSLENKTQNSLILAIIDRIIFPMFKMYQATQAQITNSLKIAISSQNINYLLLAALEMAVSLVILVYMIIFYKKENEESINRIGRILLLPLRALKNNFNNHEQFLESQWLSKFKNKLTHNIYKVCNIYFQFCDMLSLAQFIKYMNIKLFFNLSLKRIKFI